jgi:fatty-acyl-CoA synthase
MGCTWRRVRPAPARGGQPRPGIVLTERDLQDHVRGHLARYQVPREVVFVDHLPRNTTGKILKRELR